MRSSGSRSSSRARRAAIISAVGLATVIVVFLAAWVIDSAVHRGDARRNITVGTEAVGGLSEDDVRARLKRLAQDYEQTPVVVDSPGTALETDAGTVGLSIDVDAAMDAVFAVDDDVPGWQEPVAWAGSLFDEAQVPIHIELDEAQFADSPMADVSAANRLEPTEPSFAVTDGVVTVESGVDGTVLPLEVLEEAALPAANAAQLDDVEFEVEPSEDPPEFTDAQAQQVAAEANEITAEPLTLVVGLTSAEASPAEMRSWMRLDTSEPGNPALDIDLEQVEATLNDLVGDVGTPVVPLTWEADGEDVSYTEGEAGTQCCTDDSAERLVAALETDDRLAQLELETIPPEHDAEWAESMQITQPVSSTTTPFPGGQPRVRNIHRISDLTRGVVIEPGETFSVNDHVGRRTIEKGFVEDAVIYEGRLTQDVGGGVSQYATTLFNAAFFAGLDIPAYQMHTLYISRYPYGREATLSHPAPDLQIRNNTPYGVLLWPTYDETSVTVTLYSTPWIEADQTAQSETPAGPCTRVTTERTRTWLEEDRVETDNFTGLYQPADGVRC